MNETGNSKLAEGRGGYERLECWQLADEVAVRLYGMTRTLLKDDRWLRSQIMSAALSVPSNIVEGYSRDSNREFAHFLTIARASLAELEYQLRFIERVGLVSTTQEVSELRELIRRAGQTTFGLLRSVRADTRDATTNRRYLRDQAEDYTAGSVEFRAGSPSFEFPVSSAAIDAAIEE